MGDAKYSTASPTPVSESVESRLIEEFGRNSIMLEVARCESGFRQFDKNGNVLRGRVNNKDVGIFQVNEYYHLDTSEEMGIDIHTISGNIEYAKYLYETQGVQPWAWSNHCHGGLD